MNPSKELLSEVLPHVENTILKIDQEGHWVNIYYEIGGLTEINIYELAFLTRDWFKKYNKHLTLNQSIEDIFNEANNIYEDLSRNDI